MTLTVEQRLDLIEMRLEATAFAVAEIATMIAEQSATPVLLEKELRRIALELAADAGL